MPPTRPVEPATRPSRATREIAVGLLAIAAAGIVFAVPSLPEPFGVDQGIYAYIAERLLEGKIDYRDVFDHKPPGIHFAYALAFAVLGHAMRSVWLLDLVAAILTAWGLYGLGRRWVGAQTGLLAGLLYLACYEGFLDHMSRAQPEAWVNLCFVAGLLLTTAARGRFGLFAAGAALGLGFCFKPTIVVLAILCGVVLGERIAREPAGACRRFGFDLAAVVAGAAVTTGVVLLYHGLNGALRDFYEAVWVFNRRYHGDLQLVRGWKQVGQAFGFVLKPLYAPALLAVVGLALGATGKQRRAALFALAWLALAFATIFWQGSFQKGHYALVLPPLVVLAALGIDGAPVRAAERMGDSAHRRAVVLGIGALVFCLFLLNLRDLFLTRIIKFSALAAGRLTREQYYATFPLGGDLRRGGYSFEDARQIAAFIETQTAPGDPIYVWGYRPLIAWLARRAMPTRYCFRYPLTRTGFAHWWSEFLSDLDRSPPVFFVVATQDRGLYHPETSREALERNYALNRFLKDRYTLDHATAHFEIYRLRAPGVEE